MVISVPSKKKCNIMFHLVHLLFSVYWCIVQIKRRSRVPGVMITQFVEEIPKGLATPDFTRKPFAVTTPEGKETYFFTFAL